MRVGLGYLTYREHRGHPNDRRVSEAKSTTPYRQ
jgi:hypothetical protein